MPVSEKLHASTSALQVDKLNLSHCTHLWGRLIMTWPTCRSGTAHQQRSSAAKHKTCRQLHPNLGACSHQEGIKLGAALKEQQRGLAQGCRGDGGGTRGAEELLSVCKQPL